MDFVFYAITGQDRFGKTVTATVIAPDPAWPGVAARILARPGVAKIVVQGATPAEFRKYQRSTKNTSDT